MKWYWLPEYLPKFVDGLILTIELLGISIVLGMMLAIPIGLVQVTGPRPLALGGHRLLHADPRHAAPDPAVACLLRARIPLPLDPGHPRVLPVADPARGLPLRHLRLHSVGRGLRGRGHARRLPRRAQGRTRGGTRFRHAPVHGPVAHLAAARAAERLSHTRGRNGADAQSRRRLPPRSPSSRSMASAPSCARRPTASTSRCSSSRRSISASQASSCSASVGWRTASRARERREGYSLLLCFAQRSGRRSRVMRSASDRRQAAILA